MRIGARGRRAARKRPSDGAARRWVALALVAGLVSGAPVAAGAPVPGGERRSSSWDAGPTYVTGPAGCTAFPDVTGPTPDLHTTVSGWYGPVTGDDWPVFQVRLTATVAGSVTDASGAVYRVAGRFVERDQRSVFGDLEIVFRGTGRLVVTGPAGTFSGPATAAAISGPPERQLAFADGAGCNARG